MKAARIHDYGHSDRIEIEDIAPPEPGPGEVLIAVRDAGVNPVDWKIREGLFAKVAPRTFPFTLGQDFCGEVLAIGPGVEVPAGSEVYGFANGTYAEYLVVSPDSFSSKPAFVTDAVAASLPTPGLTALQIVEDVVRPTPDQTILIHGAAGAVGSIATQLCLAREATVIATASRVDASYLIGLGVTRVIDYRTERFEDAVRGIDVDVVIDLVGGETFTRSLEVVREGGLIVTTVAAVDDLRGRPVRAERILMRKNREDLLELARLVDAGIVRPRSPRVLPVEQARTAQDMTQRHAAGKLVLAVQI